MRLLQSDLYDIFVSCTNETLSSTEVKFSDKKAAGVVIASKGYPNNFIKDVLINNVDNTNNIIVHHAGMKKVDNSYYSNGGRVLTVTSIGNSYFEALQEVYEFIGKIEFSNGFWRNDIGFFVTRPKALEYADSGVDINEGNRLVDDIKGYCAMTKIPGTDQVSQKFL